MKTRSTLLAFLSTALVAATASTAVAQPSTAAAAAPQTHDWNDVNHVNGQVVPVGETNSYVKKFRRTNISVNPIGMIAGMFGISGSYAINDHVAIRADANYFHHPMATDTIGLELGVGVPIYLRRTYQGAFVEPGVIVRSTGNDCDGCSEDVSTTVGPQVLFGWHWTWDSGLNVAAAVGLGRNLNHDEEDYSSDELFPNGYFRVGYAF